ncbi:OmpA family protein [Legionella sp. W05-934-2]|jgi:peptidoglycan-associated lipoprotein|uniref:OmpA family protein n=1 Tax=Legionella sp. W05-934-2 TaxID=1198649 RepID=UPI00346327A9
MMLSMRSIRVGFIAASLSLIAACSHKPMGAGLGQDGDSSTSAYGVNGSSQFGESMDGEQYTTKAPHNQVWLFAYDDDHVNEKYMPALEAQANYLQSHPNARILLAGHTDLRGSREYNVALGERRAKSVARLLRQNGVRSSQYRIVSYGKERPIDLDYNESAHQKNRRVELIYEATR